MRALLLRATLAVLLFVPSSARAQTLSLTESEALARLSPESPRVRAIRAAVELARADVHAAGRWPNPRVTFDREAVAGTTEYIMSVGQLLPINGQRGLQVRRRLGPGRRQRQPRGRTGAAGAGRPARSPSRSLPPRRSASAS